jgi:adenylate cyclase
MVRIVFGLTIPLLLFGHVVSTRVAYSWFGEAAQYQRIVANLARDGNTGWQLALLAPGWLHGCMGLNIAYRHRRWYRWMKPALIAMVVALPLLAAAGYWAMLGEVTALLRTAPPVVLPSPATAARGQALNALRWDLLAGYFGLLALVLASRSWRDWRRWRGTARQR